MERRLAHAGILSIEDYCSRKPRDAGDRWGSVNGDRLWYLLHGFDLPEKASRKRSIGHSHVLSPAKRGPEPARLTARRLLLKAAARLRRGGYTSRQLVLHARFEASKKRWRTAMRLPRTADSFAILAVLDRLWPRLVADAKAEEGPFRLRMIASRSRSSSLPLASSPRSSPRSIPRIRSHAKRGRSACRGRWTGSTRASGATR